MKMLIISLVVVVLSVGAGAAAERPVALLFPATAGEGAPPAIVTEATQAMKTYLRQTGKADVIEFDPESVVIRRAVMEHRIKPDDLVGVTTPDARLRLGKLLGVNIVVSGDVSITDDRVTASVWLANVETRKIWRTESSAGIVDAGDNDRATSNALQSATSSVIYQLANEALKGVGADAPVTAPNPQALTTAVPQIEPTEPVAPAAEPAAAADGYLVQAEEFLKAGDEANAILEYRKAVNADPANADARIKLARLYAKRKMYSHAIDELERARTLDPENDSVRKELMGIHEARGTPEKAAEVLAKDADKNPKDASPRLASGDYYRDKKMFEEAEEQYRLAAQADPTNPVPHERLLLLFASQSMFNECRNQLMLLQQLDKDTDPKVIADRYGQFASLADQEFKALVDQYDKGAASFWSRRSTREYYYDLVKGIGIRVESIARFLEVLKPPDDLVTRHRRRILGCSLMSQACAHMLRYLETNKTSERDDATIMASEARKQITP
ncbi:MAG: tetratricopeptide repeat protein [Armatimonadetes bacterium]|nr:tetratricopeptide repeat protein [Armatimonadota bacterium]